MLHMELMRINKYLAKKGIGSRREIDSLLEKGKILVNDRVALVGDKVSDRDKIVVNGREIKEEIENKEYYLLNKPKGVISASKDDRGRKTVVDLIKTKARLFPIGRLDYDTEGLIILTNDGDIYNKIIHPRHEIFKTYIAILDKELRNGDKVKLESGIKLEDGMTLPARVKILKQNMVEISIREGRNRQVRRMFKELRYNVLNLKRIKIGKIELKGLSLGEYRSLTKDELEYIKKL